MPDTTALAIFLGIPATICLSVRWPSRATNPSARRNFCGIGNCQ